MSDYASVTPEIVSRLEAICGRNYVIYRDEERLEPYSHDEIPGRHYRRLPEVVVRPQTTAEVSAIVKLANAERIPVTPRGAGSGLSGGAVPVFGGILVATDRMNRILELDKPNMMIVVEPGVVANDINEYLRPHELFYAGYPMSMETCYIGGNVAENAGGGKAIKYGVTARYVLGLEVVLPSGEVMEVGGKLLKDVTGYNLLPLLTGSEGTLGIFTKIILKVIPRPKYQYDLLALFPDSRTAIEAVPATMVESGIIPTSIEYLDKESFRSACAYLNETLPYQDAGAMLLVSVDGNDPEQMADDCEALGTFLEKHGATVVYVADTPANSERIWKIRRNVAEAFSLYFPRQSGEDIVVPPASIAMVVEQFSQLAEKYGVTIPCYGHAGDGNLHSRVSAPDSWSDERWDGTLPKILHELYAVVAQQGGRISGEHGIGCKRLPYMSCVVSETYLDVLRSIKRALDPNNIMNPGKIFTV
ncbi:MAG: FAD-linked oxidase C-terminal domain-containing protein [Lentisphaeria bacterium]|nr:FAD-linked oxidase C-terminal domain-containing protein [Lentisphaeria bacterium]